jgi:hypothetical protein
MSTFVKSLPLPSGHQQACCPGFFPLLSLFTFLGKFVYFPFIFTWLVYLNLPHVVITENENIVSMKWMDGLLPSFP